MSDVRARLEAIRRRIADAATAAGRKPTDVRLVAVSKLQPIDKVFAVHDLGVEDFGENTAQGLVDKATAFAASGRKARWHYIGKLQRNKVNHVLPHVSVVQSVDRDELAEALSKRAPSEGLPVLVQVNIGREPQKGGVEPSEAVTFAQRVAKLPGLSLRGLMGIPPIEGDPAPYFKELAALSRELVRQIPSATELSMGMTSDFEVAIEQGATMVRIGTAIFGER